MSVFQFTAGEGERVQRSHPASDEMAKIVIESTPESGEGRSNWFWVWMTDGSLMLACYPQGDTYFATETEHSA